MGWVNGVKISKTVFIETKSVKRQNLRSWDLWRHRAANDRLRT